MFLLKSADIFGYAGGRVSNFLFSFFFFSEGICKNLLITGKYFECICVFFPPAFNNWFYDFFMSVVTSCPFLRTCSQC